MDSVLISDIVVMRLQSIALKTNLCISEVVEALLDYHGDDQEIIDAMQPPNLTAKKYADTLTGRILK